LSTYRELPLDAIHPNPFIARILKDPKMHDALATGQRRRAHEMFVAHRKRATDPEEIAAIDAVLEYRRNFIEPIKSAPPMFTYNGVGTYLLGNQEPEADGTYISTLWFALVLPVFPIADYVVRSGGGNSYFFLGKVPPNKKMRRRRKISVAAFATLAAAIGFGILSSTLHAYSGSNVWVANDLDIPVTVSITGKPPLTVAPHKRVDGRIDRGPKHVVVKDAAGRVLEESDVKIPGATDVVVINVLGASPLYYEDVEYGPTAGKNDNPRFEAFGGQSFVERDRVQFVFSTPPKSIQTQKSSGTEVRGHFDRIDGGINTTMMMVAQRGGPDAARAFARKLALAQPESDDAIDRAEHFAKNDDERMALVNEILAVAPASFRAHRIKLGVLDNQGKQDEARAEYRALAQKDPEHYAILSAQLQPRAKALELAQQYATAHPKDVRARRAYGYELFQARRFDDAARELDTVAREPGWERMLYYHARALIGANALVEAQSWAASAADDKDHAEPFSFVFYAMVARMNRATAPHPPLFYVENDPPDVKALVAAMSGEAVPDGAKESQTTVAVEFAGAVRSNPTSAIEYAEMMDPKLFDSMHPTARLLVALEAARVGKSELAKRISDGLRDDMFAWRVVDQRIRTGTTPREIDDADLEVQAAVALGDARASKDPKQREALMKRAFADDLLKGFVTDAATSWPAP
jgi:hypothetical protein